MDKIKIGIVGLQFGGEFPPIYRDHPDVEEVILCDRDAELLNRYGNRFGFARRFTRYDEMLAESDIDAIHIVTPIHAHPEMTIRALNAGKHCACTVPMATTIDALRAIIDARQRSGKRYMMMETAVYTRHCLHVRHLIERNEIGNIQYMRGAHYQDDEGWPDYWKGLPPMHYATHAVAPLLALSSTRATKVHCFGSGTMREDLVRQYGNPYPIETAIFRLERGHLAAEVSRSLFHTARDYVECFTIFGDKKSFEWNVEKEDPVLYELLPLEKGRRGREVVSTSITPPDYGFLLPKTIAKYTVQNTILDPENPHMSLIQGGGHHGSHPHLVHEFVRSIVEDRKPWIDDITAANWCAAGICAHESAL
ncbi:MAG: Gfo/Idh/MocA family oxidoreductase, partial [Clostridia bacterium]|nr:Gfo/Idh/MocA family oxidoreductase [Clostridia bacterium]